jgi:DNA polymerase IV
VSEPILHVDMDAFYASVEILKDPSLAGRPVLVGGPGPRGVVMSASYEARRFGVRSAMPSARARRLCPDAVFVRPDFVGYRAYSTRLREILLSFTPLVEPLSLDEAFLDVSGATTLFGPPPRIAERVRARVREELSLVCSVGVASNKFLAKLASARAKPDGVVVVPADGTEGFLHPLPVDALWGVGERTEEVLHRLGIRTVAELARTSTRVLERALGEQQARHLAALAAGRDERAVVPYEPPKQVSHEETFDRDLDDEGEILRELLRLSFRVAARLRKEGFRARTVVLKVRLASFTTLHRSRTLADATDTGAELYRTVTDLYRTLADAGRGQRSGRFRVRLLGVAGGGGAAARGGARGGAGGGGPPPAAARRAPPAGSSRRAAPRASPARAAPRSTPGARPGSCTRSCRAG